MKKLNVKHLQSKLSMLTSAIWKITREEFYSDDDSLYLKCQQMKRKRDKIRKQLHKSI